MTSSYLFLCLLSIVIFFVARSAAIVNGNKARVDQFPYQVSLQYKDNHPFCDGGIIHEQFILTCAHCILNDDNTFKTERMFVLAGTNDLLEKDKPAVTVEIQKIFVPVEYKPNTRTKASDIAIVKLKHALVLSKHIKALHLPNHKNESYFGKTAEIAGFGWHWAEITNDVPHGGRIDTQLRYLTADILEYMQVDSKRYKVPDNVVHAKVKNRSYFQSSGVCIGDSGSPLVHGETVIGILYQTAYSCLEKERGGLYTNVSYFLDFIKKALEEKEHDDIRAHVVHH